MEVQWFDHWEPPGSTWWNISDLPEHGLAAVCTTVGFVVFENDDVLMVSASLDELKELCGRPFIILKVAIKAIRTLV